MKIKVAFIFTLLSVVYLHAQTNDGGNPPLVEPFTFTYGKIPFGKGIDEVLKLVEGASVELDKNVSASFISEYGLEQFDMGIYTWMGMNSYLNNSLAKSYTVRYDGWENISQIELFFTRSFEVEDYTLIMVNKTQKMSVGAYENIYNGLKKTIINALGNIKPTEFTVKWQDSDMKMNNTYLPGIVGLWKTQSQNVFLLVRKNIFNAAHPTIVYVSVSGWSKYLSACKKYEAEKKKKEEDSIKADF